MIVLDGMTKENYNQRNSNWEKHLKTVYDEGRSFNCINMLYQSEE